MAADVTGTGLGPGDVAAGRAFTPPYLISGAEQILNTYGAAATFPFSTSPDVPISFTTSSAFGKVGGVMSLSVAEIGAGSLAGALEKPDSGLAINNYESSFPAAGGAASPGFPATRQGASPRPARWLRNVRSGPPGGTCSRRRRETFSRTATWTLVTTTREGYLFAWSTMGPCGSNELTGAVCDPPAPARLGGSAC